MEIVNRGYFKQNRVVDKTNVSFYDVKKAPFKLYGLYNPEKEEFFKRIPTDVALNTNTTVAALYTNPAGARVRFTTDSGRIVIEAKVGDVTNRSTISQLCSAGFDVYIKSHGREEYHGSIIPPIDFDMEGYDGEVWFGCREMREITVYLPLYNSISSIRIGVDKDAVIKESPDYSIATPVVYYGSSITQGACASRPANSYEAIASRWLDCDFINLGFAGSARGEDAIVDYMAYLEMSAFVSDYDHNAPTPEHLQNTHFKLYSKIREKHPDIPYIMLSRPTVLYERAKHVVQRRIIVFDTYKKAIESGDTNVYFIDGFSLFEPQSERDSYSDGTHPNDLGFRSMAQKVYSILSHTLK